MSRWGCWDLMDIECLARIISSRIGRCYFEELSML